MPRLQTIKPTLSTVKTQLVPIHQDKQAYSRQRDQDIPWRKLYKTARWQRLRWKILEEAHFTCAMCGYITGNTKELVADHIIPHKGDEALFWDRGNLQCLCKKCHDGTKRQMERRG